MASAGCRFRRPVRIRDRSIEGGFHTATELLTREPHLTALFASNDLIAIGAMQAATALGVRCRGTSPSSASPTSSWRRRCVRPDDRDAQWAEVASEAIKLLLELIKIPPRAPMVREVAKPMLIRRESTAPPK